MASDAYDAPITVTILLAITLLLAPLGALQTTAAPPAGPVILNRFIRAVGGEAAIRDIEAMHARGRIIMPGEATSGDFEWWVADGDRCRFVMTFPGLGSSQFGSDGSHGWEVLTLDGQTQASTLTLEQVSVRRGQANWFELALTIPKRARTFETIGPAEFDGHEVWEVKMVDSDQRVQHLFFDQQSHLLHGVRMDDAAPANVTIRFQNWKPVGPLRLFRVVSIDHAGVRLQMNFDEIHLDPVSPEVFMKPADAPTQHTEPKESVRTPDA